MSVLSELEQHLANRPRCYNANGDWRGVDDWFDELRLLVGRLKNDYVQVPKAYIRKYWEACVEFPNWTENAQENLKQLLKESGTSIESVLGEASSQEGSGVQK